MKDIKLLIILMLPFIGTLMSYYMGTYSERRRDLINILVTGINLALITVLFPEVLHHPLELYIKDIMGTGLHLKLDVFRYVFVWVTALVWFLTILYSTQYLIRYKNRNRYYAFFMLTYASTLGIFISDNLLNLFTFFEVMSLASYALVIHDEDEYSHEAGRSYISMAIAGGLCLLMGLILLYDYTGTLIISDFKHGLAYIGNVRYIISGLIIVGFGVKASMMPLHSWLPKAHPAAPTPASAILSGILIKTGIFGIMITALKLMHNDPYVSYFLVIVGCLNILHGGILALMQRNIKRILAYSSMSQAGYIILGIGLVGALGHHGGLALVGTLYHIFNHALFKVLLFMGVGIIYTILHELSINKISGFGNNKKYLRFIFMLGFLAIIGMPGTNGFISKTLLHEAIVEAKHEGLEMFFTIVEYVFTIGGSLTVAYLLKIFIAVFVESNEEFYGQYKRHVRKRALFPMAVLGAGILFIGFKPDLLFHYMGYALESFDLGEVHSPHFYSFETIKGFLIPFTVGSLVYIIFVRGQLLKEQNGKRIFVNPSLNWIELERDFYRPVIGFVFVFASTLLKVVDRGLIHFFVFIKNNVLKLLHVEVKYQSDDFGTRSTEFVNRSIEAVRENREQALTSAKGLVCNSRNAVNDNRDHAVSSAKGVLSWSRDAYAEVMDKSTEQTKNMREIFILTGSNLNSLVYTVLTFIFVLVMILVLMMQK